MSGASCSSCLLCTRRAVFESMKEARSRCQVGYRSPTFAVPPFVAHSEHKHRMSYGQTKGATRNGTRQRAPVALVEKKNADDYVKRGGEASDMHDQAEARRPKRERPLLTMLDQLLSRSRAPATRARARLIFSTIDTFFPRCRRFLLSPAVSFVFPPSPGRSASAST